MQKYVLGFIFTHDLEHVFLIRKNRPVWQCGLLNGVGGHVEAGEKDHEAMSRKALEECGYIGEWTHFAHMGDVSSSLWDCPCYYAILEDGQPEPHTMESEAIERVPIADVPALTRQMIPHVPELIFAALQHCQQGAPKPEFLIQY